MPWSQICVPMRVSEKEEIYLVGLTLDGCNEVNGDNHENTLGRSRKVAEVQGAYVLLRTRK